VLAPGRPRGSYVDWLARSTGGIGVSIMGVKSQELWVYQAAQNWLERPQRTHEGNADMLRHLNLRPNRCSTGIRAGSGFFSFRMAKLVPEGKSCGRNSRKLLA